MVSFHKALAVLALLPAASARIGYPDSIVDLAEGRGLGQCHDCSCFTCDSAKTQPDGSIEVTVGHCKDGSISWMCCTGVDGVEGNCQVDAPCAGPKCNTIPKGDGLTINLPAGSTSFSINTHDGQTAGDGHINTICGGRTDQGGGCAKGGATAHCEIDFDLVNDCPNEPEPQPQPQPEPEPEPQPTPGSYGDPHVKTWAKKMFDFHGGCDLVLLDNPSFHNGLGMTVHIRTEIRTWWSFIKAVVIRIGDDTLEVQGGKDQKYLVNGVEGDIKTKNFEFSSLGLKVLVKRATDHQMKLRLDLLNSDAVGFEVFNDFVRVNLKETDPKWKKFAGSVGLMGTYPLGETVGRDGNTLFTDMNAFGQEWQVTEQEPKLFSTVEGPQHPTQCTMPETVSTEEKRRRLGTSMITKEDAELACARVTDVDDRSACVFDVLATNDKDMAGSY